MINPELDRAIQKLEQETQKESALLHGKEEELKKAEEEMRSLEKEVEAKKITIDSHRRHIPTLRREIDAIKMKQRGHLNEITQVRTKFGTNIHDPKIRLN